ncbi:hypothetical protein ACFQI7_10485 [Paenibacillus allorhizosphaerae]|uniref:Uncharacterized protein n=1 Tax=Paenibacillus allorhizosphaerae TaxID=2849866 RepID=A0ABM8VIJ0_9BACL|nr:hypothetical protein [Paenibacillus allorhizosphaerae]CAG7643303.1 hypothetical protein PAECIP111802_02990 [Paenibacillus allorhizosphaerae]
MRTENQIKRKLNELTELKKYVDERLAAAKESDREADIKSLEAQSAQLEELAGLLEWVLNEPVGKYHV